jgi:nicotinamidase-related amidase
MNGGVALLVIDVQNGVVDWSAPSTGGDAVLARIGELLSKARESGAPVIFVQHDGEEGGRLAVGSEGWRIHPRVAPSTGETVVRKRAADSFYETTLREELERRGVRGLVVAGCRTQYCVDTTCRAAVSLGYDVTLAADAHTTADGVLPAPQIVAHHNSTLDDFGNDRHVVTVKKAGEIDFK